MSIIKKLVLPVGLFVAFFVATYFPGPGIICKDHFGVEVTVILIFLISGYFNKFSELKFSKYLLLLMLLASASSLVILPIIGTLIARSLLPFSYALGLIVIVCMPSTLSSGVVITEVAQGNSSLAILLTICLNFLGLISIPFVLKFLLGHEEKITINSLNLFIKLLFLILIPFFTGKMISVKFPPGTKAYVLKLVPPISVAAAVWMSLSASSKGLFQISLSTILYVLLTVFIIHIVFLLFNYCLYKIFRLSRGDMEAFIFVVSQKTLSLAILLLYSISAGLIQAVIACVFYHFMQILVDSLIAGGLSGRRLKQNINPVGTN